MDLKIQNSKIDKQKYNLKADTIMKDFFRDNDRFADFMNGAYFDGQTYIKSYEIEIADSSEAAVIFDDDHDARCLDRNRDVIRKVSINGNFAIISIENQKTIDYDMPLRVLQYDTLNYTNQRSHKKSGKLLPSFTLVFYHGPKKWTGPMSLRDMMEDIPSELETLFNNWEIKIVDINELDIQKFHNQSVRNMIEGSQKIYKLNDVTVLEGLDIDKGTMLTIGSITQSKQVLEVANNMKEGEVTDMCEALDNYIEKRVNDGIEKGLKEGLQQGIQQGIQQMKLSAIKSLMSNLNLSAKEAMNILQIPYEEYRELIFFLKDA